MFEEEVEIPNCPAVFRDNCVYRSIQCHRCKAFDSEQDRLQYRPILNSPDLAFKKHPYFIQEEQQKKATKQQKQRERRQSQSFKDAQRNSLTGRKVEKKVVEKAGFKGTARSGAKYSDGDGKGTIKGELYHMEHKTRLNNRNTLGPTSAEWETAKKQNCQIFMTTSEKHGTVVTMSLETFKEIKGE